MCIKREHIDLVVSIFNSYHKSLQFTYEMEINNIISFLDMTLINKNNRISTNWYQKPTFSSGVINFLSKHPIQQKRNIIYNLTDRAIVLSDKQFHLENLKKIKNMLILNEYPSTFIEQNIRIRLQYLKYKSKFNNKNTQKIIVLKNA